MSETGSAPNEKDQIRDDSDHPETETAGDRFNADLRHDLDFLRPVEASLYRFVDRPLPLDSVISLGAQFLCADEEDVAEAVDHLVQAGYLCFAGGMVDRPGVSDIYNESLPTQPGGSPQLPLDAEAAPQDPIEKVYEEWNAIARRHPEWTITALPGHEQDTLSLNPDDPASIDALRGKIGYDPSSVKPEDKADFERFLALDAQIEEFEGKGGLGKDSALRASARWRMAGGRVASIGLLSYGIVFLRTASVGRGDLVQALAEEIAERDHGAQLSALPPELQVEILQEAEERSFDRFPMTSQGEWGSADSSSSSGMSGEQPPAPDPEKAPQGWDKITGPDGKPTYRSKTDPNVKLERPDPNAPA